MTVSRCPKCGRLTFDGRCVFCGPPAEQQPEPYRVISSEPDRVVVEVDLKRFRKEKKDGEGSIQAH